MGKVVVKVAAWFVIFIILITLGLEMISAPNTIENVIGFFMVVATLYLSVRTKCLTAIKLMKSKLILGLLSLFMVFSMTSCMEKVDAGCEGIKVNLYGNDKGVDDASLVTGIVWYNPWTTTVYEYPTYVQTIDYEPFTINAKDGSEFTVDPTVSLKIIDGKSPAVFKKYRKELNEVIRGTLYNYVKDAFRIQLNKFTTDDIVSKRDSIENAIERYLTQALAKENFQLEQLTSGLKYPQTIVESVNAKNKAIQQYLRGGSRGSKKGEKKYISFIL